MVQNWCFLAFSSKMNSEGSNPDCYFYYNSFCRKGSYCPFRHCEAALGSQRVCTFWLKGRCLRESCKFRHPQNLINRATTRCYWENQPSGCLKPHCIFQHRKRRFDANNNSAILPVSTSPSQGNLTTKASDANDVKNIVFNSSVESYSSHISSPDLSPTAHPVEPIVVSVNGEESDSESACSTPMKSTNDAKYSSSSVKKNLMDDFTDIKENNFGIKTLEQIKMEKIHKESEHFYKNDIVDAVIPDKSGVVRNATFLSDSFSLSVYDSPVMDPAVLKGKANKSYKAGCPESDSESACSIPMKSTVDPKYISSSVKKNLVDNFTVSDIKENNFGIKSLEQIKLEKMHKESEHFYKTPYPDLAPLNAEKSYKARCPAPYPDLAPLNAEKSYKARCPGKRKEIEAPTSNRSPKQLKTESSPNSSNNLPHTSNAVANNSVKERSVRKANRPIIKRNQLSSSVTKETPATETGSVIQNYGKNSEKSEVDIKEQLVSASSKEQNPSRSSVDELDDDFLLNEYEQSVDYEPDSALKGSEEILSAVEKMLES